jgi:multiple sugar transport system ATP-binding protein
MAAVTLSNVVKLFGDTVAVKGIDLQIDDGSFVVFVGPSGCGKSTILRMIAGLELISYGEVRIGGRLVNDLPARDRGVAMVFQSYGLYPHMTVAENLAFGMKVARVPKAEADRRLANAVTMLGLGPYLARRPAQLSGGQRQRVAIGRAMVREPEVFLFDEPLSNLDAMLRTQTRIEIKRLQQRLGATTIFVTHDQVEAMTLADRMVVLLDGQVAQQGPPIEVFERPANRFVAGFIGSPSMNFLDGTLGADGGVLQVRIGALSLPIPGGRVAAVADGRPVVLGLRPEHLVPEGHGVRPANGFDFAADVAFADLLGSETILFIELGGKEVLARMQNPRMIRPGERLNFRVDLDRAHLFDPGTGNSLMRNDNE